LNCTSSPNRFLTISVMCFCSCFTVSSAIAAAQPGLDSNHTARATCGDMGDSLLCDVHL
jgi:hypothetical protein